MVTIDDWQTPDEVIARNVTRIRKRKKWKKTFLADRLGVSKHVVHAYEGGRVANAEEPGQEGRAQRPFRWKELVELCYVLECTLYELVLPNDPDTKVDLIHDSVLGESPITEMPLLNSPDGGVGPRSEEIGLRLFRYPGDKLLESDMLKELVDKETEKRRAAAQQIQDSFAEYLRRLEEMFPDGLSVTITDETESGRPLVTVRPTQPADEEEEKK
jgi:DNA-binding Xre family transcriptional regulator